MKVPITVSIIPLIPALLCLIGMMFYYIVTGESVGRLILLPIVFFLLAALIWIMIVSFDFDRKR